MNQLELAPSAAENIAVIQARPFPVFQHSLPRCRDSATVATGCASRALARRTRRGAEAEIRGVQS